MSHPILRLTALLCLTILSDISHAQLTVGASSELRPAMEDLRRLYSERTGNPLRMVYLPPAKLVERAFKGGIDCIFVPEEWADTALERGMTLLAPEFVASSPMTAWSRQGRPLPDSQLSFLLDTTIHGIAVTDPLQSPDGARVLPFLNALSADSSFRARWRVAPEPSAAIDSIVAGSADAALLPQSAFWSSAASGLGRQLLLDSARVAPQRTFSLVMIVAPDRQENAKEFLMWAKGPQATGIWRRNGFRIP